MDGDALDDKEYEGNLIYLLTSACDFIKNNSKTGIFFLDGPNGFADHIDIWNGKKSGSGIYKSIKVWFWEIK